MRRRNPALLERLVFALVWLVCLIVSACSSAGTPSTQATPTVGIPAFATKLQPLLQAKMQQLHIPGAMVDVDIPGQGSWTTAMGTGDLATHAPLDLHGHYRIASITKM